jgi:pyruvate dehydrogenase E2 component (dihydrolipoamide acetyltransferase)
MRRNVIMPHLEEAMEEGKILKWLKKEGEKIGKGESLAEIESAKATVELESFYSGTLVQILVQEGETVAVGTTIAVIDDGTAETGAGGTGASGAVAEVEADLEPQVGQRDLFAKKPGKKQTAGENGVAEEDRDFSAANAVRAAPSVRRLARKYYIDLSLVKGSGVGGRILREDLRSWLAEAGKPAPIGAKRAAGDAEPAGGPKGVRAPVVGAAPSKARRAVAEQMVLSKTTIPHFYVSMDIEMSRCLELRDSHRDRDMQVTLNDIVIRAVVLALQKYPNLNATCRDGVVRVFPNINICFAVDTDRGLLTPVIGSCEELSLGEVASRTKELVERAKANRLKAKDLAEGTFTVTNLGMYGVSRFQAIINPPQVAILAVGVVNQVPSFDSAGNIVAKNRMEVTLSVDHRVTDGSEAARFLQELKAILEDGYCLLESNGEEKRQVSCE